MCFSDCALPNILRLDNIKSSATLTSRLHSFLNSLSLFLSLCRPGVFWGADTRSFLGFRRRKRMALLSELATEILIPICAVVGIAFSLVQWFLVSRVKLTPDRSTSSNNSKNGYNDYLIEEEEGVNDHSVVTKCAEIQNAISEGEVQKFQSRSFSF